MKIKRYFVTSAIPGSSVNKRFLNSIENYCAVNDAELLVIPTQAVYSKEAELCEDLLASSAKIITDDTNLNSNLKLSTIPINPEQVDPVMGLDRLSEKQSSVIYASPKQRLKSIPSPAMSLPRVIMTPGSVTNPFKKQTRRSLIAAKDHVMGGIIVEIESAKFYHFRQVQAGADGSFIDLGVTYNQTDISQAKVEALVPGDWHTGYTDPDVKRSVLEICTQFKPKYLILHDFFDGITVNHHINGKFLSKAAVVGKNSLANELMLNAVELKELSRYAKEVLLVKSNHDEFLDRWLDSGDYLIDYVNHALGLELAFAKSQGKDPLEYGLKKYQTYSNVTFLKSDESFLITKKGIECGVHGHLGSNGARGSSGSIEKSYINSVTGHTHSPEILRNAFVMGTSSYLKLSYNKGPSSWMQTMCIVYENGSRQLINVINKKWRA